MLMLLNYSPNFSTGEYALAALLGMVLVYTLALSHMYNTPFSASSTHSKHWWKARLDVTGWIEQHQQYVEEAVAASDSPVITMLICHTSNAYENAALLPHLHASGHPIECLLRVSFS